MSIVFDTIRLVGSSNFDLKVKGVAITDNYILKTVDGLGPPDVDVFLTNTVNQGGTYLGKRPVNRQIVLRIGLNPDYSTGQTPADLRAALYDLLTPGDVDYCQVLLRSSGSTVASTFGYVSKFETVPFSKDPEVQITIDCPNAYLDGAIESITGLDTSAPSITNDGQAPTGFYMEIALTASMSSWQLTDANGKFIKVTYAFLSGDTIYFDTQPGSRGIFMVRSGSTTGLMPVFDGDSDWLMLKKGVNALTTSDSHFTYTHVEFTQRFWGI